MTHWLNRNIPPAYVWMAFFVLLLLPAASASPLIYVAFGSHVDVVDLETKKTIATIPLTTGVAAGRVLASPDGRRLYVATGKRLAAIDTTGYTVSYFDLSRDLVDLRAVSPDGNWLYVTVSPKDSMVRRSSLVAIDTANGNISPTAFGAEDSQEILVFLPDSSRFYLNGFFVEAVDSATGKQLGIVEGYAPAGAVTPDGRLLYLVHNDDDQACNSKLTVVDTSTNQIVREDDLGKDFCPKNIVISPDGAHAYLADALPFVPHLNPKVHVLDLKTRQGIAEIDALPFSMAISQDGKTLVLAENMAVGGTIRVVDALQNRVVDTIVTSEWINAFALAPTSPQLSESPVLDGAAFLPLAVRGGIASLFGSAVARGTQQAASVPLPKSLLGTVVATGGIPP